MSLHEVITRSQSGDRDASTERFFRCCADPTENALLRAEGLDPLQHVGYIGPDPDRHL